jgi:hypothetical protein
MEIGFTSAIEREHHEQHSFVIREYMETRQDIWKISEWEKGTKGQ